MIKDPDRLKRLAELREEENFRFRRFLKDQDSKEVDEIVHRLHNRITNEIDCTECGNCCNSLRPGVTNREIERLAGIDGMKPRDFEEKFVEEDYTGQDKCLKDTPCKYLKDKKCSIYSERPGECKSYPHTHKPNFASRTFVMIQNYGICPIVFNLMEELKLELRFTQG